MIQLHITRTGKGYSPKDEYSVFDEQTKSFKDMAEAKAYLKETYGNCKRQAMYRDNKDGNAVRIGYIYGFRNQDWSHSPSNKWLEQGWVSFSKVTELTV